MPPWRARAVYPALKNRYWQTLISPSGSFIGSDNPVTMDGPKGGLVGFKSADIVIFTLNRFLALYGTNAPLRLPHASRRFIASHNSFTMISADEQLYSQSPDFCRLDASGHIETDFPKTVWSNLYRPDEGKVAPGSRSMQSIRSMPIKKYSRRHRALTGHLAGSVVKGCRADIVPLPDEGRNPNH